MITRSFVGIRNTISSKDIQDNALTSAVDVDINDAGVVLGRNGYQKAMEVPVNEAYTTFDGTTYVISENVIHLVSDDLSFKPLQNSMATEFCDFNRQLFTNDGLHIQGDVVTNLAVPAPDSIPQILGGGVGLFCLKGQYSAVFTYVLDGLEGASSHPETFNNPFDQHLRVQFPSNPLASSGNAYLTSTNGGGGVYYNVDTGVELSPENLAATDSFPAADKIEFFDSRLYCSEPYGDYTVVWYSQRFYYHLYDKVNDYFIIPGRVEAMKTTQSALIIATFNEIYAYDGISLTKLADYGVPKGRSMVKEPLGDTVLIHAKRGVCRALPFQNITEKNCQLPTGTTCSAAIVHEKGFQKLVALRDGDGSTFNPY